jgi:hypothetical protein
VPTVRRVTLVLAVAAFAMAAACEPAKKAPPKDTPPSVEPGSGVFYFVVDGQPDGTNLRTSPFPQDEEVCTGDIKAAGGDSDAAADLPRASQTREPDGSVALAIEETPQGCPVAAVGFGVPAGTLGSLTSSSLHAVAGSDTVGLVLALDGDGDGNYGGEFGVGFGADELCVANPAGTSLGALTVLNCLSAAEVKSAAVPRGTTLTDLKATAGNVPVAILAVMPNTDPTSVEEIDASAVAFSATVDSLKINGSEQLR